MKFTRTKKITDLAEGTPHTGTIHSIAKVNKRNYYEVEIKMKKGLISLWVSDNVTPEHPMFEVFNAYIENEKDAENFDENEIVGTVVRFSVKKIATKGKDGEEVQRTFFDKVEPIFEESEEDDDDE